MMKMGELLALCRELKNKSLRDIETETGISNAILSQYETGKIKNISLKNAVILCDYYGLSLERLANTVRKATRDD